MRRSARLPLEQLQPFLWSLPPREDLNTPPERIDWADLFGNDHPVEVEVGFGKGMFLLNASQKCPEVNFFGIEIERKYQLFAANRIAKRELKNVRLACQDARMMLRDYVASDSIQGLHVYFPDPWWKKRHHKRRVFTDEFARDAERILRPEGILYVVSDVEEYFEIMEELISTETQLQELPPPKANEPEHDLDYLTNFERKFRKEGRPIHRARYAKGSS